MMDMARSKFCSWMIGLISVGLLCSCGKKESLDIPYVDDPQKIILEENNQSQKVAAERQKRYDLPVEDHERREAEADCKAIMEMVVEIYRLAEKSEDSNVVLSKEVMFQMKEVIKETGYPVIGPESYSTMENHQKMEDFLLDAEREKAGTLILYQLNWAGGIGRSKYIYEMKYKERFNSESYPNGIPAEEFECVTMEYLPVTSEQIREWAVFDEQHQSYVWVRQGCMNYSPTFVGTSLPEVSDVEKNADGSVTLTVEAVCDMIICDDTVITHELTVRLSEDGSFQYLGNKILNGENQDITGY